MAVIKSVECINGVSVICIESFFKHACPLSSADIGLKFGMSLYLHTYFVHGSNEGPVKSAY